MKFKFIDKFFIRLNLNLILINALFYMALNCFLIRKKKLRITLLTGYFSCDFYAIFYNLNRCRIQILPLS